MALVRGELFGELNRRLSMKDIENNRSELTLCGPSNLDALRLYFESLRSRN
jgi:hypothetical protein